MRNRVLVLLAAVLVTLATMAPPTAAQAARTLSFADAVAIVLRENLLLRAAALDVTVAAAQLAQARSGLRPRVDVGASYTRSQERSGQTLSFANPFGSIPPTITVTLPPPAPDLVLVRMTIEYPLYTGGRVESQIALAEASLRGAQAVFRRSVQQAVFAAQQAYLQALLADEMRTAARRSLAQAEETLRVAQARAAAGAVPPFDVLQAEVAEAVAQQAVARTEAARDNSYAGLNLLLGLPLETSLLLTDAPQPRAVSGTLAAAIERAVKNRPELAELRARIDAARAAIALARSGGRPNVAITGAYDYGSSPAAPGGWSVTLGMTLALSDGGLTRERVHEAEARLAQVQLLEADRRRIIELEVRQAWRAIAQADVEIAAASAGVSQAREAVRLARVRYEAGVGTALEMVSAQAAYAQAEATRAQAAFAHVLARAQLALALGGPLE